MLSCSHSIWDRTLICSQSSEVSSPGLLKSLSTVDQKAWEIFQKKSEKVKHHLKQINNSQKKTNTDNELAAVLKQLPHRAWFQWKFPLSPVPSASPLNLQAPRHPSVHQQLLEPFCVFLCFVKNKIHTVHKAQSTFLIPNFTRNFYLFL